LFTRPNTDNVTPARCCVNSLTATPVSRLSGLPSTIQRLRCCVVDLSRSCFFFMGDRRGKNSCPENRRLYSFIVLSIVLAFEVSIVLNQRQRSPFWWKTRSTTSVIFVSTTFFSFRTKGLFGHYFSDVRCLLRSPHESL
jgi:hypothetical protein